MWPSAPPIASGKGGRKPRKGAGTSGFCTRFQEGKCPFTDCRYPHVCKGCGGPYGFTTCRTCNPGSAGGPKSKKNKKNKGGKGAGASGSAK